MLPFILAATRCYGNRQDQFPPSKLFVAVGEGLWDNGAACERRYKMRCLSGADRLCKHQIIDVKVVDFCSQTPCPSTIKLSTDDFTAISHHHDQKINVEYIQYILLSSLSSCWKNLMKKPLSANLNHNSLPSLNLLNSLQDLMSKYHRARASTTGIKHKQLQLLHLFIK